MICPQCGTKIFDNSVSRTYRHRHDEHSGIDVVESIYTQDCPECDQYIVEYESYIVGEPEADIRKVIWPKVKLGNRHVPSEVPDAFAEDYKEACLVLEDSPKASAALSRRCLQLILRDNLNVAKDKLHKEIQEVIKRPEIPSYISDTLDHIRTIGNFAAHPNKYNSTGEIVPVEQDEAEWCLKVIEDLFDFCFVAPARAKRRQQSIDNKFNTNQ